MVLNVSSLLKTVKAVEDEHTRGTRAMEATVEAISQEIRVIFHFIFGAMFSTITLCHFHLHRYLLNCRILCIAHLIKTR